ncbi:sulfite exporter TauE/SafE family protein [Muriicola sp.]|uniref:sulfite exporter TauE/SafE family protein n=1 Tax=Muriicola sp. TaxID=2020856 RepID=UPI003C750269
MVYTAFLLGLMGSLHCVGMCGPIAFMLPLDREDKFKMSMQVLVYHLGRMGAYALLGLAFGYFGKGLYLFGAQQYLSIGMGILMILAIVIPQKKLNTFRISKPVYRLISGLKSRLGALLKKRSADTFVTIGFLNGFLPCGLVYMALFASIAMASPLEGSLYMVLFGLGTVPLMTSAAFLGKLLKTPARKRIRQLIPIFVVLVGILFILRGMGLGIPFVSPKPMTDVVSTQIECHQP